MFFFFNDTATTEIYTLSLHDALPICVLRSDSVGMDWSRTVGRNRSAQIGNDEGLVVGHNRSSTIQNNDSTEVGQDRSEEHTSELQSHLNLVCRLLLEKKNRHVRHQSH